MNLEKVFEKQQKHMHQEEFFQKEIKEKKQRKKNKKKIYFYPQIYPLYKRNMIMKPPYILDFGVLND
jgi:hypothetical protein